MANLYFVMESKWVDDAICERGSIILALGENELYYHYKIRKGFWQFSKFLQEPSFLTVVDLGYCEETLVSGIYTVRAEPIIEFLNSNMYSCRGEIYK